MAKAAFLVLRFSALGDAVLATAFLQRLRAENPDAEILFFTSRELAPLARSSFPGRPRIFSYPGARAPAWKWFSRGWRFARRLRDEGLELGAIYDLHGIKKSRLFCWGLRLHKIFKGETPPPVKQSPKHVWKRWLLILFKKNLLGPRWVYQEHLRLLGGLSPHKPQLHVGGELKKRAALLLAPDARHWKKRWPAKNWIELAQALLVRFPEHRLTLVGGKKSLPLEAVERLIELHPGRIDNLLGTTRIEELPRLAAEHQVTLCGNSAWLHISEAVGTRVVTLAGPIVPSFGFSPWRPESRELGVELGCRPCSRHGGGACFHWGEAYHKCMRGLSVSAVLSAVGDLKS